MENKIPNNRWLGIYHVDVVDICKKQPTTAFETGYIDRDEINILYPIDPMTGMRSDILSQIVDPETGDLKRNQLLSLVPKVPDVKHRNVDDDTQLSMLKSRYSQSRIENDHYAEYVANIAKSAESSPSASVESSPSASVEPSQPTV